MYNSLAGICYTQVNLFSGLTRTEYDSAWSSQKDVYFSAVGRSFYEQCLPRNSVHVGYSSHAVMYLSTRLEIEHL